MLQKLIKVYEGDSVGRVTSGLIFVPIEFTGTLVEIDVLIGISFGTAIFTGRLNGAILWSGGNRISITVPATVGSKTGLTIPVVKHDAFHLDLVQAPSTPLAAPIVVTLIVEDGVALTQDDIVATTALIADGVTGTGTLPAGKSFLLKKLVADKHCRIRLYKTAAYRTADAARAFGDRSYRGTEHGIICDVKLTAGTGLEWDMSPDAFGSNGDVPGVENIYYAIENNSGSTGTVQVTFSTVLQEV